MVVTIIIGSCAAFGDRGGQISPAIGRSGYIVAGANGVYIAVGVMGKPDGSAVFHNIIKQVLVG